MSRLGPSTTSGKNGSAPGSNSMLGISSTYDVALQRKCLYRFDRSRLLRELPNQRLPLADALRAVDRETRADLDLRLLQDGRCTRRTSGRDARRPGSEWTRRRLGRELQRAELIEQRFQLGVERLSLIRRQADVRSLLEHHAGLRHRPRIRRAVGEGDRRRRDEGADGNEHNDDRAIHVAAAAYGKRRRSVCRTRDKTSIAVATRRRLTHLHGWRRRGRATGRPRAVCRRVHRDSRPRGRVR